MQFQEHLPLCWYMYHVCDVHTVYMLYTPTDVHVYGIHVYNVHVHGIHVYNVHVYGIHVYNVHVHVHDAYTPTDIYSMHVRVHVHTRTLYTPVHVHL